MPPSLCNRTVWSRRASALLIALCAGAIGPACDTEPTAHDARDPTSVEIRAVCAEAAFDNVVDEALCPKLQAKGLATRYAQPEALCRRLAIDITGQLPTWAEVESACMGRTAEAMVDHFMAKPTYVRLAQRRWADHFEYTDAVTWWRYIEDLDALVGDLYEDTVDYETFAIRALTHPGFTGRYFGEMRVARAFQVFIGRDAHPVERADIAGLWMMWAPVYGVDPDYGFEILQIGVATAYCAPPLDELLCHSRLYGEREVALPLRNPDDPADLANIIPIDALTDAEWAVLRQPGELIASMPAFREHAVSEVLDRLLGWEASRELPAVVEALGRLFEGPAGGSIRAIEREVLTSALYLQPVAPPEVDGATSGLMRHQWRPLTRLPAEIWLDGIQSTLEAGVGWCDHRYPFVRAGVDETTGALRYHPHDYPVADAATNAPSRAYQAIAQPLGGCPDRFNSFRFEGSGPIQALLQEQFMQLMCYRPESSGLLPGAAFGPPFAVDDSAEALSAIYRHQVRALLTRDPDDAEVSAFLADTVGCDADGRCDLTLLPGQLCETLIKSAEFLFY